ncbi:MAG: hypothetical protein P9M00_04130 [Candidatus Tritonobacter lacicola]|nr:hypothetical protein [Candidatus Tritonobacter lacicola]
MTLRNDLISAAVLSAAFLFLLIAAESWRRLGKANPEWTRKLVHLCGGMICLAFPWCIQSPLVVLVMAAAYSLTFAIGKRTRLLESLHGVSRKTRGSEYYPLSIFLIFLIAHNQPWLYTASVLVLAVADAFAGLIGSRYGSMYYEVEDDHKSLEGSLVFLVLAFLAIHLPMLLMTDIPRATCVLAALLVAVLVTGFEAISLGGADNLFVPLGVCVILSKITSKPLTEVVYQNLSLAGLCLCVSLLVWRVRSFNVGATIALVLFTYGAWSLGSELWALPILLGIFAYLGSWFFFPLPLEARPPLKVRLASRALIIPLILLMAGNMLNMSALFYGPFIAALAVILSFSLWNHLMIARPHKGPRRAIGALCTGAIAWGTVAVVPWLVSPGVPPSAPAALLLVTVPAAFINDRLMGGNAASARHYAWSASRLILTFAAAGTIICLQLSGLTPQWRP